MMAPIVPAINSYEIFPLIEAVAKAGASDAHFTIVRLNGAISELFEDWVHKNFPDRAEKVLNQIKSVHGGKLNDSRFGMRMRGEGIFAEQIHKQFALAKQKFMKGRSLKPFDYSHFVKVKKSQFQLF